MSTFRYQKPPTAEAISALLAEVPGARPLAGGTDLIGQIRSGAARPPLLVDVKGAPELDRLEATAEGLEVGAAVILNRGDASVSFRLRHRERLCPLESPAHSILTAVW